MYQNKVFLLSKKEISVSSLWCVLALLILAIQSHAPEKQAKFLLEFYFVLCLLFSILSWYQEEHSDGNVF